MQIVSWNVNGIRAAMDKGFREFVTDEQPDVVCLQETKAQAEQVPDEWADAMGYQRVWNSAQKKGYSGTSIWSKVPIQETTLGIGKPEHDQEGRVITVSLADVQLVCVYTPNAQRELVRLDYRMQWDAAFLAYVKRLQKSGPVVFCGDLNCAHHEIDLANPKTNRRNAGFTDEERSGLDKIQRAGFVDAFRHFESGAGHYSWWSYRSGARARNIGWRLDYFWVSQSLIDQGRVQASQIHSEILGSDHCPVSLTLA